VPGQSGGDTAVQRVRGAADQSDIDAEACRSEQWQRGGVVGRSAVMRRGTVGWSGDNAEARGRKWRRCRGTGIRSDGDLEVCPVGMPAGRVSAYIP
jgi:hypothetical protein